MNVLVVEPGFLPYEKEIKDGAEPSGLEAISVARKEGTKVESKAATERAAAYVNYADQTEFLD